MARDLKMTIQGAPIFVRLAGEGPPVLLLHGNPDSADLWNGLLPALSPTFRCIAPDMPGFGRSATPEGFDFSLSSMSAFVDDLVTKLGIDEPLRLVVHDFGGPYGLSWAVEHPDKLKHIVVVNSLFTSTLRWHFWAQIWRTPILGEISMRLMNRWLFAFELRRGSRRLSGEHIASAYEFVNRRTKRTVLDLYRATDPEKFRGWEERLHDLARTIPVNVLWGREDPYLDESIAHTFGSDDVEIFDGTGHWLPAEAPSEMSSRLLQLWCKNPTGHSSPGPWPASRKQCAPWPRTTLE